VTELATALVDWLAVYTYPVATLTVLIGHIGVPFPASAVVIAAGSFAADGEDSPSLLVLFTLVLTAAVTGDLVGYSLGRWAGLIVLGRWGAQLGITTARLEGAERRLERWGDLAVFLTRFLLTGLTVPTNLVAGASSYPLARFLAFAIPGSAIWTGQFLALGWWLGPNWVWLLDYLGDAAIVLTTLTVAAVLIFILVRQLGTRAAPAQP
jgi:membrane protein DedA with SNARE-associated domain